MNKNNYLYKLQKNKEYKKLLKEEKDLLDIALQISQTRRKRKITQVQLAKRAGMPQSQIARIESGNHNVTIGTLNRVAGALNLRVVVGE
ncbi:MAG: helix-turn-helix transcriptional regulator [Patescibacteria group bacterium]|jgi:predicted transcriptional regulator